MGGEILESRVCFKDVGPVTIVFKWSYTMDANPSGVEMG
jgi:hypothetical protein